MSKRDHTESPAPGLVERNKGGRPTLYQEGYARIAREIAGLDSCLRHARGVLDSNSKIATQIATQRLTTGPSWTV